MWTRRWLWGLGTLFVLVTMVPLFAAIAWDSRSSSLRQQLDRAAVGVPDLYSTEDLDELPAPVERFFRHVLKEGQPLIRAVDLVTEGQFQTGTTAAGWKSFTASQRFSTRPPGFVWDAHIQMAPFMPVYVRDAYVGDHTEMRGNVLGLFPVVAEAATRDLAAGQLHRYLAETIWFPTALLPAHHRVFWEAIDATSAIAMIHDRGMAVSLRFTFTPDGDVREVFASDRMRAVNGGYEPTPWAVRCNDYQDRQGMRIPTWCEAEWRLPEGPQPYWRGRVTNVRYELAVER